MKCADSDTFSGPIACVPRPRVHLEGRVWSDLVGLGPSWPGRISWFYVTCLHVSSCVVHPRRFGALELTMSIFRKVRVLVQAAFILPVLAMALSHGPQSDAMASDHLA